MLTILEVLEAYSNRLSYWCLVHSHVVEVTKCVMFFPASTIGLTGAADKTVSDGLIKRVSLSYTHIELECLAISD
jgi:hypothetical protein